MLIILRPIRQVVLWINEMGLHTNTFKNPIKFAMQCLHGINDHYSEQYSSCNPYLLCFICFIFLHDIQKLTILPTTEKLARQLGNTGRNMYNQKSIDRFHKGVFLAVWQYDTFLLQVRFTVIENSTKK